MKYVLTDYRISKDSGDKLKFLGYQVIKTEKCSDLQEPVCGHPDMLVCKLSDRDFAVESTFFDFFASKFPEYNFIKGVSRLKNDYPYDIAFNCARVGKYLICNEKYADFSVLEYCRRNGIKILNVKQGYAKCSVCVVSENAIITADKGIFKIAEENGIDALLIGNTGILLDGYGEGFFGGATGLLERDLLAVNGNLELHKDCDAIKAFCLKYGVKTVSLSDAPITDVGTIIRL